MLSDAIRAEYRDGLLFVLILVLMEYALWQEIETSYNYKENGVLILVLMEYALWH